MSDKNKSKHLTMDDRLEIQEGLTRGETFKTIAHRVGKAQTTISREVKRNLVINAATVRRMNPDGTPIESTPCPKHLKAPFVCNPCEKRHRHCSYSKQLYSAKHAQKAYETLLVEAREGIPLNKQNFYEMDRIVSDGIKSGQHLYHISQTNDLGVSKSTVYRHLHRGYLSVSAVDFPRVVKFKPRRIKKTESIPKEAKRGRTYEDFQRFIEDNDISSWIEMDTVIGRIGGKVILTLNFTFCNFMAGILLDDKTAAQAAKKIMDLKRLLAAHTIQFGEIFPLLLTDNGGEFAHVSAFENTPDGEAETRLFFCDPMRSSQKPRVEKNHTLFRDIVPKGESFDDFTQETVNLIFSHVNSVKRKSLNGKSPIEVFAFTYGEELAELLGIRAVPANQVLQSPKLLRG
ncbi:MAG: IS30 family transposase [Oscillospiraceae bacterium]|jgi:IS30 family transposase|nr:IS30 family transposase [Oscillospiraceae bacterium]